METTGENDTPERLNPYAPPEIRPLRGYWARFFPAVRRALSRYRTEMRREKMGIFAQLSAWLALFFIFFIGAFLVAGMLFVLLVRIVGPIVFVIQR